MLFIGGAARRYQDHVGQEANQRQGGPTGPQETQDLQTGFGETQNTNEKAQPRRPETETRRDVVSNISETFFFCLSSQTYA